MSLIYYMTIGYTNDKLYIYLFAVQMECETVTGIIINKDNDPENKSTATKDKLIKRLKLLYTLVNRINSLYNKDDNDELFSSNEDCGTNATNNITRNNLTYIAESPRKVVPNINLSRSVFARGFVTRTLDNNNALKRMPKRLKSKQKEELNFSVQLDKLFSGIDNNTNLNVTNTIKESSVLYNYSPTRTRLSLRKAVLNKKYKKPVDNKEVTSTLDKTFNKSDVFDATTTLQITGNCRLLYYVEEGKYI